MRDFGIELTAFAAGLMWSADGLLGASLFMFHGLVQTAVATTGVIELCIGTLVFLAGLSLSQRKLQ